MHLYGQKSRFGAKWDILRKLI